MATKAKPLQWKKGKSEWLRGEGDQIKFIDLKFERWQFVRFRKSEGCGPGSRLDHQLSEFT